MQNLEQAIRDLQNAENAADSQQALESASERLQESLQQMQQARQQRLQDQLAAAADEVRDLTEQQRDTAQQLRDALQRSIEARNRNEFSSGLTAEQQDALAEQKRQMQRDLEKIRQQLTDATKRFAEDAPETSERLQQALDQLDATKASELMGIAGDMIEEGLAPQASLREQRVTEALRNLQRDINEATESAVAEAVQPGTEQPTAADAARSIQTLRQALSQSLQRGGEPSQQGENGGSQQAQGSPGGQRGNSQAANGEQQGNQPGTTGSGQPGAWGQNRGTLTESTPINGGQQQLIVEATTELTQLADTDIEGLSQTTITDMQAMAEQLRLSTDNPENDRRIDADVRLLLRQLEQLELSIYRETQGISGIRSARNSKPATGFSKRTADYFKRLSEDASGS